MRTSAVQRKWALSWRAVICASLALAYLGFVGEAIHCQYFAEQHQEHGSQPSKPISHATHCLVANHGTSATIHTAEVPGDPPAQHLVFLLTPGEAHHKAGVIPSRAARGPPAA